MAYATVQDVDVGTKLIADGGFTCLRQGEEVTVERDTGGDLVVPCADGRHCLDGQLDEGDEYIGFRLAEPSIATSIERVRQVAFQEFSEPEHLAWEWLLSSPEKDTLTIGDLRAIIAQGGAA